jgi:hypothetical protein
MENNNKLGQTSAFPTTDNPLWKGTGMNKRFYAACTAMQGLIINERFHKSDLQDIITKSFILADELLKQENL